MLRIEIKCFFYVLFSLVIFTFCFAQKENDLLGNVYTYHGKCDSWTSIYINAIRIQEAKKDLLKVGFLFGVESVLNFSMQKNTILNLYELKNNFSGESKNTFPFFPETGENGISTSYNSPLYMKIVQANKIRLTYMDKEKEMKTATYQLTYKDSINPLEIRDPYYSGDGFFMCPRANFKREPYSDTMTPIMKERYKPIKDSISVFGIKLPDSCFEWKTLREKPSPNGEGAKLLIVKTTDHFCWAYLLRELEKKHYINTVYNNPTINNLLNYLGIKNAEDYSFFQRRASANKGKVEIIVFSEQELHTMYYLTFDEKNVFDESSKNSLRIRLKLYKDSKP